jgi:hypothetical protein
LAARRNGKSLVIVVKKPNVIKIEYHPREKRNV